VYGVSAALAAEGGQFDQRRNSKNECRMSQEGNLSILKRLSNAKPPFDIRIADHVFSVIRYSTFGSQITSFA
jgi:hypothetical protein